MLSKETQKRMEALGGLYSEETGDWDLKVHHCLTEPTCPTAIIAPEGSNAVRYRFDADTIEEAITGAVNLAYEEQILGRKIESVCPFTNPDDHNGSIPEPRKA